MTTTSGPSPTADRSPRTPGTARQQPSVPAPPATTPPAVPPRDEEAVAVEVLVARLRERWTVVGADIATRLRPGVAEERLQQLRAASGVALPPGAHAWFRCVDGVDPARTRGRTTSPTVGPGAWVPLSLDEAVRRTRDSLTGPAAPPGLLPLFARHEELLAVRWAPGSPTVVEHLVRTDDGEAHQHSWRVPLVQLLSTWADALVAAVVWLPDTHDWVGDPFALHGLPHPHLLG